MIKVQTPGSRNYNSSISMFKVLKIDEALPGVLGKRGQRLLLKGYVVIKGQILTRTREQRQYWGTWNIRKHIFDFWGTREHANLFEGKNGTIIPWEGLIDARATHQQAQVKGM